MRFITLLILKPLLFIYVFTYLLIYFGIINLLFQELGKLSPTSQEHMLPYPASSLTKWQMNDIPMYVRFEHKS